MINVLVTGAGSLVGHGILRCLRLLGRADLKIFTADPDHRAAGHWLGSHALKLPLAKEPDFIDSLVQLINQHRIDVLFVGTDPELDKVSKAASSLKCATVVSSPNVILVGEDKWETVNFLKNNDFDYPLSALSSDVGAIRELLSHTGYPLIAKPRTGARSIGLKLIRNDHELETTVPADYLIQEYLPEGEGEFTAGTMTYNSTCYSQVIFRRDLKDGNTYRAYTYVNTDHENFLKRVSELMPGVYGPLNFQYRLRNNKPVIFEINSRFSGTTPLRAAVGVNEVGIALEYIQNGAIVSVARPRQQVAILRTWSDVVVSTDQIDMFKESGYLKSPKGEYFPFMS